MPSEMWFSRAARRSKASEYGQARQGPTIQKLPIAGLDTSKYRRDAISTFGATDDLRMAQIGFSQVFNAGTINFRAGSCQRAGKAPNGTYNASSLTQLVYDKTGGNPFFAIQFLASLAEESLPAFDQGEGRWSWNLNRIHAKGYTDNVVDLMVEKLSRLPTETQNALKLLACLGNTTEFNILRMVYQDSGEELHGQLWEAVRAGLVGPLPNCAQTNAAQLRYQRRR